jgi:hypothetical protein
VISRIVARRVFQPLNEPLNACFSSVDSRPILTGGYGVPPYKHMKMRALLRVWKHAPNSETNAERPDYRSMGCLCFVNDILSLQ